MIRSLFTFALGVLAVLVSSPLNAEPTPAPPEWNDAAKSVYLPKGQPASSAISVEQAAMKHEPVASIGIESNEAANATMPQQDSALIPASHEAQSPASSEALSRRLAPPSRPELYAKASDGEQRTANHDRKMLEFGLPTQSIYTIATALTIVIGAFLIFAWALRRGTKKTHTVLPADVASVVGRVPLAARQFAELLRVGNKLVLVSLTPNGAEPLTEVTDPVEVDRLLGLCQQYDPRSTTKAFEQVFQQLSSEPGRGGFLGDDSLPATFSPIAGAYRAQRGVSTRA
jgi:flagellar biogenesis protein FliO